VLVVLTTIIIIISFEEMPTNNYVESAFWNFDALFQPQQVLFCITACLRIEQV